MSNNSTDISLTLLKPNTFYRLTFAISLFDSMYNQNYFITINISSTCQCYFSIQTIHAKNSVELAKNSRYIRNTTLIVGKSSTNSDCTRVPDPGLNPGYFHLGGLGFLASKPRYPG